MEKEIYFGRAYQMNLVSERKNPLFFLIYSQPSLMVAKPSKWKKSDSDRNSSISSSKVYFIFRFLFFATSLLFLLLCHRYLKSRISGPYMSTILAPAGENCVSNSVVSWRSESSKSSVRMFSGVLKALERAVGPVQRFRALRASVSWSKCPLSKKWIKQ
jgi:hypothetical protein